MSKKLFDALGDIPTSKIQYSNDITKQIDAGTLKKEDIINNYLSKLLDKDFGQVAPAIAQSFTEGFDSGDRDIYGIYDDVVIYYDAEDDDLAVVSKDEFLRFYRSKWFSEKRIPFNVRYGGDRLNIIKKGQFLKEGQRQEILKKLKSELGEGTSGFEKVARLDYKVFPYELEEYLPKIESVLGQERMDMLRKLSEENQISLRKLLGIFAFQHFVQHKNTEDSFNYVLRAIERGAAILKSKDSV